jgi:sulfur-carrier protein
VGVKFQIPGPLRAYTAGSSSVEISGSPDTLREALNALFVLHPALRDRIQTEEGAIRRHVNLFVGNELIRYTGGLATPVRDGSEISIVPAISGGDS